MKTYLLLIDTENEKDWQTFKSIYKKRNLGKNLSEAILSLVKQENIKR